MRIMRRRLRGSARCKPQCKELRGGHVGVLLLIMGAPGCTFAVRCPRMKPPLRSARVYTGHGRALQIATHIRKLTHLVLHLTYEGAVPQMVVRALSSTETVNVQVLYIQACTLAYSIVACLAARSQLVRPSAARDVAALVAQGFSGYFNQARLSR
jgi:hypothetical protein